MLSQNKKPQLIITAVQLCQRMRKILEGKNPDPELVQGSFVPNLNRVYIAVLSMNVDARS